MMKKLLILALSVIFAISFIGCNNEKNSLLDEYTDFIGTVANDIESDNNEIARTTTNDMAGNTTGKNFSGDIEWRKFLKEYEEWVDSYIDILKKYQANPTDMSILSDYTEMVSEMTDWTNRADEIELELNDTEDALEYSAELLRIAAKLAEVAY